MAILTRLILLTQEHEISFHLFVSPSISNQIHEKLIIDIILSYEKLNAFPSGQNQSQDVCPPPWHSALSWKSLSLMWKWNRASGHKTNAWESVLLLYTSNKQSEMKNSNIADSSTKMYAIRGWPSQRIYMSGFQTVHKSTYCEKNVRGFQRFLDPNQLTF